VKFERLERDRGKIILTHITIKPSISKLTTAAAASLLQLGYYIST